MSDDDLQYRLRQELVKLPRYFTEGDQLWYAEAYYADQPDDPVAYIKIKRSADGSIVVADYARTDEEYRRQGIATRLLEMTIDRWPTIEMEPWTPEGEAFLACFSRRRATSPRSDS